VNRREKAAFGLEVQIRAPTYRTSTTTI
jgi:hypothetical protein